MNTSGHWQRRTLLVLVKKCSHRPKTAKAIFVTIVLSWFGLHLSMNMSLVAQNNYLNEIAMTPRQMQGASSSRTRVGTKQHHPNSRQRHYIRVKKPRGVLLPHYTNGAASTKSKRRSREKYHDHMKPNHQQQHLHRTRYALHSSRPYAQKSTHDASRRPFQRLHAFVALEYLDTTSMMGEDDDSLDSYYAMDDDLLRGSDYKKTPRGYHSICSTPSFYRLYRPTCNDVHSSVSGYQWLMGEGRIPNHHHNYKNKTLSRYLGAGMFRQVFLLERQFATNNSDEVVFKSMKRFAKGDTFEKRIGKKKLSQ